MTIRLQRPVLTLVTAMVVTAVLASLSTMAVADEFDEYDDIPDGWFFDDPVTAVTDAGCANRFNDGDFRPNGNVSRGQFTLWFQNCLPRTAHTSVDGPVNFPGPSSAPETLASDSIEIGGFEGETQFLRITAVVDAAPGNDTFGTCGTGGSQFICPMDLILCVGSTPVQLQRNVETNEDFDFPSQVFRDTMTIDTVVQVDANSTVNYSLRGNSDGFEDQFFAQFVTLTAQTMPFGPTGGDTGP